MLRSYRSRRGKEVQCKIWEACRATAAASSFFEPIRIGFFNEEFVDGAVGFNNPINEVLAEARDLWSSDTLQDNLQCVISIGTGQPPLLSFGSAFSEVSKTLSRVATETEKTAEAFFRAHAHLHRDARYFRFNVLRGLENVGMEEHSKFNILAAATRNYIASQSVHVQLDVCAAALQHPLTAADSGTPITQTRAPQPTELQDGIANKIPVILAHELPTDSMGATVEDIRTHDSFQSWLSSLRPSPTKTGIPLPGKKQNDDQERSGQNNVDSEGTDTKLTTMRQKLLKTKKSLPSTRTHQTHPRNHFDTRFSTSLDCIPKMPNEKPISKMDDPNASAPDSTSTSLATQTASSDLTAQREQYSRTSDRIQDIPSAFKPRLRRHISTKDLAHLLVKTGAEEAIDLFCPLSAPLFELIKMLKKKGEIHSHDQVH
jgi:hypothetical protein